MTWKDVPGELLAEINLVMPFLSSGYYDPGSMYGGPDGLGHPPESDDERLPDGCAYLDFGKDSRVLLTETQTNLLAEYLREELLEADLEPDE